MRLPWVSRSKLEAMEAIATAQAVSLHNLRASIGREEQRIKNLLAEKGQLQLRVSLLEQSFRLAGKAERCPMCKRFRSRTGPHVCPHQFFQSLPARAQAINSSFGIDHISSGERLANG